MTSARARLGRPAVALLLIALIGSAVPGAAAAQEIGAETSGEVSNVEVRIVARRLDDGRVEFGLQQRGGDHSWGDRLLPSRRFFPTDAAAERWLSSSRLVLSAGSTTFEDPGAEVEVRIVARRLADGRVEFGLQQRGADGSWGDRLLPSRRFFPAAARADRWLASSALSVTADAPASIPSEASQEPPPEPGSALIAASPYHTCTIRAGGGVDCWGDNRWDRLGDPAVYQARSPVPVPTITDAVAITIGESVSGLTHGPTCVLHGDQSVSCWGWNRYGVLGQGTPGDLPSTRGERAGGNPTAAVVLAQGGGGTPVKIPGISDAVAVSAGSRHVCVVHSDGGVSCWGSNTAGQLGDGTQQSRNWPYRIPGLSDVAAIGAADRHTCAVHVDGTISCWGSNHSGALGDGTTTARSSPVRVRGIDDAVSVSSSEGFTCAVRHSGGISCWGRNVTHQYAGAEPVHRSGLLGTGSQRWNTVAPAPVRGIRDAVAVATGHYSSCALHRDGAVSCWGTNVAGQLGIGTMDHRYEPQRLAGIHDAVAIAVSGRNSWDGSHACAVTADRDVLCWGHNRYGQLGVGDTEPRSAPAGVVPVGAVAPNGNPTVVPRLTVPDWGAEEWRVDPGPFREAMDDVVRRNEGEFPWLRIAWEHVRDDVRIFEAASGGVTTVSCRLSDAGTLECRTSQVALGTDLNERSMQELLHTGVHELAHVYDQATALTPNRAWGAVQLYFAVTYPGCRSGGDEVIADAMMHLIYPEAPMTYYGPGSSCPGTPDAPSEQEKSILRSGLAGEVPAWYTANVTDGAALWHLLFNVGNLTLVSNLMEEFGGFCRTDFLMNPGLTPPRNSNPFRDGGC